MGKTEKYRSNKPTDISLRKGHSPQNSRFSSRIPTNNRADPMIGQRERRLRPSVTTPEIYFFCPSYFPAAMDPRLDLLPLAFFHFSLDGPVAELMFARTKRATGRKGWNDRRLLSDQSEGDARVEHHFTFRLAFCRLACGRGLSEAARGFTSSPSKFNL
jgi:hypothetical protein